MSVPPLTDQPPRAQPPSSGPTANGLLASSAVVALGTLVSRVLGLLRDTLLAITLGAGGGADAFFVAFKVPNFMRRLFAEGAFAQALVPVLAQYQQQRLFADVQALVAQVATLLVILLSGVCLLGVLAAPWLAGLFAPGFLAEPDKWQLTVELLRITFPYLLLVSLVALSAGVMNSYHHYATPAWTPVVLNLSMIFGALVMVAWFAVPAMALAWSVLLAGLLQLLLQLPMLCRLGFINRPRLHGQTEGVKQLLRLMGPALLAVSVVQINLLFDTLFASFLIDGSVSWLYYADRLAELPLDLIGIVLATVILPVLARQHQQSANDAFAKTLAWAMRLLWWLGLPATGALVLLSLPLVSTLFLHGAMQAEDARQAAQALWAYALGLPAFMLIKVLVPGWFARQDSRTPLTIAVRALGLSLLLNLALIWHLGHLGLALSTSLAAWFNAVCLWHGLVRLGLAPRAVQVWASLWRPLLATLLMLAVLLLWLPGAQWWLDALPGARIARLSQAVALGLITYAMAMLGLGFRGSWLRHRA